MGKRKERRLAALSNAGRRVKLDLFAEPSDMGGSSVREEVDGDPNHPAGLPNSPSSSGKQPPNPLLLLGQYSDDDLDEELDRSIENENAAGSLSDQDDKGPPSERLKDTDENAGGDVSGKRLKEEDICSDYNQPTPEGDDASNGDVPVSSDSVKAEDSAELNSAAGAYDVGDVGSGWKMVMHEESNQYYYWNTETGETSWELPEVLALATQLTSGKKVISTEQMETASRSAHEFQPNFGVELDNSSAAVASDGAIADGSFLHNKTYANGSQILEQYEGTEIETPKDKIMTTVTSQIEAPRNSGAVNRTLNDESQAGNEKYMHDIAADGDYLVENGLSTQLLRQGEQILDRLNSLRGGNILKTRDHLQSRDWIAECILEIEIRLSDIKALISCGRSLDPYWMHSERQLKRLEAVINDKIYQLAKHAAMDEAEEISILSGEKLKTQEGMAIQSGADANGYNMISSPEISHIPTNVDALTVVDNDSVDPTPSKNEASVEEDVDMDVDMEVEDTIPASHVEMGNMPSPLEQVNPPANNSTLPPPPSEEWIPPPPPDNEMIPPPPPDNEQIPPPPPEEPPEPSYPPIPSYPETGHIISSSEEYNASFQGPSYQYYGHAVSAVPPSSLYGHADAYPVAAPQSAIYYDPVTSAYSGTASVIVNPVQPLAYYDVQDGTASTMPVATITGTSQLYGASGPVNYSTPSLHQNGSLVGLEVDVTATNEKAKVATVVVSSISTAIQAPVAVTDEDSGASTAVPTTASAPNVQPKALRSKKRTIAGVSSLRSNKKVSSLVDKWKAAKEELNEAEEEPQNAYEMLEKKRQREIEEWRAQQIASGEAKNNANFQPLGGNWREKVKRRRAQKAREGADSSAGAPPEGDQKPDLAEISRELPSGWQAYWDESSKQVYYGNVNTSETRWERPKK